MIWHNTLGRQASSVMQQGGLLAYILNRWVKIRWIHSTIYISSLILLFFYIMEAKLSTFCCTQLCLWFGYLGSVIWRLDLCITVLQNFWESQKRKKPVMWIKTLLWSIPVAAEGLFDQIKTYLSVDKTEAAQPAESYSRQLYLCCSTAEIGSFSSTSLLWFLTEVMLMRRRDEKNKNMSNAT